MTAQDGAPMIGVIGGSGLYDIEGLEDACEDHGQAVIYRGSIPGSPHLIHFDKHHAIETGRIFPVCGNTFRMLAESRLSSHFTFIGDFSQHFGLFPGCGELSPFATPSRNSGTGEPSGHPSAGSMSSGQSCC